MSYTTNYYDVMHLDGMLLPDYGALREITEPNVAKNYALDGQLYVDFYNARRKWEISWKLITYAQYEALRAKYDLQFSEQRMLTFVVNNRNIIVPVFVSINDINIKHNGQLVEGFAITLEEQYAIS